MNTITFLIGVGFQELLLLIIFLLLFIGFPVALIVFLVKRSRRKRPVISKAVEQADILKELKSLYDNGTISKEEFESEKTKILNRD
jgi:hypothetical protein